ncbi:hypothetical protein [Stieleria maiorica]|uniref:hypothetical protein n=1 Tax=Stieleria maiorica TaxID=2795974 RepID=UPI0011CA954A|nr:hypothetical protein [Stieleria maiorica]
MLNINWLTGQPGIGTKSIQQYSKETAAKYKNATAVIRMPMRHTINLKNEVRCDPINLVGL